MRYLWFVIPIALGTLLRLWGISRQILLGDEIHGVRSALNLTLTEILTTYRLADPCIPLSALYRILMASGIRLSEELIRAPAVISGLAILVLFPLAATRWRDLAGDWRRGEAFAWLLAVSPSLVYYSRFARPYAAVVLLAPLAAAAFWRWWRGGGLRWAVVYAVAASTSAWFFLGSVPFIVAPLGWAAADLALSKARTQMVGPRRGLFALAATAAGLTAGMAILILPAMPSLLRLIRKKAGGASVEAAELADLLRLQAGTDWLAVVLLFWGLALVGLTRFGKRYPALASYMLALVFVQWVGIALILRPAGIGLPVVFNRYTLMCLPIVLLWVAEGVAELRKWLGKRSRLVEKGVLLCCMAVLALTGPYAADPALHLGPFAGAWPAFAIYRKPPALPDAAVPAVYRQIAAEPGHEPVIEAIFERTAIHSLGETIALARHHGKPVILVVDDPWRHDPRLALHTVVPPDPLAIERSGGRFLVLQLDRHRLRRLEKGQVSPLATSRETRSVLLARDFAAVLTRSWGDPHLASGDILVWDLAQVN